MDLKELVIEYQKTGSEEIIRRVHNEVHQGGRLSDKLSMQYDLDKLDVESMINEKILVILETYDGIGNCRNMFSSYIRNGCLDLYKSRRRYLEHEADVMYENEDGEEAELYEVSEVAPTTNEDSILDEIRKRLDQRQLIKSLLNEADDSTKMTVSAFLDANSYRDVAKRLGICHKTAKARIRRLERRYNESIFGSCHEYFTVPTVHVG